MSQSCKRQQQLFLEKARDLGFTYHETILLWCDNSFLGGLVYEVRQYDEEAEAADNEGPIAQLDYLLKHAGRERAVRNLRFMIQAECLGIQEAVKRSRIALGKHEKD